MRSGLLKRFPALSAEFIEHTVIEQTSKLVSIRCFDLGYIPYQSPFADNLTKLWGPAYMSRFLPTMLTGSNEQAALAKINITTTLDDLQLQPLKQVLIKNCLLELAQM